MEKFVLDKQELKVRLLEVVGDEKLDVISKKTNTSVSALSKYIGQEADCPINNDGKFIPKNNNFIPKMDTLYAIACAYNVSLDWLCGRTDAKTPDSSLQAVHSYTGLSDASIKRITNLMKPRTICMGGTENVTTENKKGRSVASMLQQKTNWRYVNDYLAQTFEDFITSSKSVDFLSALANYFYYENSDGMLCDIGRYIVDIKKELDISYGWSVHKRFLENDIELNLKSALQYVKKVEDGKESSGQTHLTIMRLLELIENKYKPEPENFAKLIEKMGLKKYFNPNNVTEQKLIMPPPKIRKKTERTVKEDG